MAPESLPASLTQSLSRGKVIPFVGAGISQAVTSTDGKRLFPSWHELLASAALKLVQEGQDKEANLVNAFLQLDTPKYLEAAEISKKTLGAVWSIFIKEALDLPRALVKEESLEIANLIWQLGSNLIITSNADKAMHWACPKPTELVTWDIDAPAAQAGMLKEGVVLSPTVWHIHGVIDNPSKIILTPGDYSRLYPTRDVETTFESAMVTLQYLLISHTFLFIGFSFKDERLCNEIRSLDSKYQGSIGPHYALVPKSEIPHVLALKLPIQFLPFEDFGPPLIECLKVCANDAITKPVAPNESIGEISSRYNPSNPIYSIPFREKGKLVVAREETIKLVREQLVSGLPTALGHTASFQGIGGLGKTQVAVEYAYRFKPDYPEGIIWLNADQDIDAQLVEISNRARWTAPESSHADKLAIAYRRLKTSKKCLIVFDNVESYDSIKKYLPEPDFNPHLLVTSRVDLPAFHRIELDILSPDESMTLLAQESGRKPNGEADSKAAAKIAALLDGLPLAIEIAGAFLRFRDISYNDYQTLLEQNLSAALPPAFGQASFTHHEANVYSTLRIDQTLISQEPKLIEILNLLTWSGPSSMSMDLICACLGVGPSELVSALSIGSELHLLQKTPDENRFAIHRLLKEVRKQEFPIND